MKVEITFFIICKAFLVRKSHLEEKASQISPPLVLSILVLEELCRNEKIVYVVCSFLDHFILINESRAALIMVSGIVQNISGPVFSNLIFNVRRSLILRLASFFMCYAEMSVKGRRRAG